MLFKFIVIHCVHNSIKKITLNPSNSSISTTSVFLGPICRDAKFDLLVNKSLALVPYCAQRTRDKLKRDLNV